MNINLLKKIPINDNMNAEFFIVVMVNRFLYILTYNVGYIFHLDIMHQ